MQRWCIAHSKTWHSPAYTEHIILSVRWEKLVIIVRGDVRPSFIDIYISIGSGKVMPQGMWRKHISFRFIPRAFQARLEIETIQLLPLRNHEGVEVPMNTGLERKTRLFFSTIQTSFSSLRLSEHVLVKDAIHVQGQAHSSPDKSSKQKPRVSN